MHNRDPKSSYRPTETAEDVTSIDPTLSPSPDEGDTDHHTRAADTHKGEGARPSDRTEAYPCPCCGAYTYPTPPADAIAYICPRCFWENDLFTHSDREPSDENHGLSLAEGRENVRKYGISDPRLTKAVSHLRGNKPT